MAADGRRRAADRAELPAGSDSGVRAVGAAAAAAAGHRRSSAAGAFVETAAGRETTVRVVVGAQRAAPRHWSCCRHLPQSFVFSVRIKFATGVAAKVMRRILPREPSSTDTRAIVSLSGQSTILTKS